MKTKPLAAFVALFAGGLVRVRTWGSQAPRPATMFTSGFGCARSIETAANAAAAQQAGSRRRPADAASSAWCAGSDHCRKSLSPAAAPSRSSADAAAIERLVLSVDVQEERRSGTRYIGRLTVRFDPTGVRTALLRARAISLSSIHAPRRCLLLPIVGDRRRRRRLQPRCGAKSGRNSGYRR